MTADSTGVAPPPLLVDRDDTVLRLVLNRPRQKNALNRAMVQGITAAVESVRADDGTRVIVITANGDDFCSGIDLVQSNGPTPSRSGESAAGSEKPPKPRVGHMQRGFQVGAHRMVEALDAVQVPVVAGVRGWAAGIGNMLALSADIVVAGESAKFWVPFVTKGFTPDSGNTWLLPRLVGLARAKEMVMRGRPIPGPQAADWGLISQCVPDQDLDGMIAELVSEMAQAATVSVGLSKTLLHENLTVPLRAGLQNEGMYEELAIRSDDFKEGMRAFAEKRPPSYTGR